jgi:hypothetical protein
MKPELFAASFAALYAGHFVADHIFQTDRQATTKGNGTLAGQLACLRHVGTLTLTLAGALAAVAASTGLRFSLAAVAVALAVNAVTHFAADLRKPLQVLMERVGKGALWHLGTPRAGKDDNPTLGTGAYVLDQSWHIGWLFISALIIAGLSGL